MFYETSDGEVINLDHLVRVGPSNGRRVLGGMSDGSEISLQDYEIGLIVSMTRSIVAARPDDRAVIVTWYGDDNEPTHSTQDVPVIAWALEGDVMAPVFAEPINERQQRAGILMPHGRVCEPFNCTWATRQDFIDDSLQSLREEDARRQQRQAAEAA